MSDAPDQFLIEKNGMYYRPESCGYTGIKDEAGRYSFEEAAQIVGPNGPEGPQDGLSMWAEADAPDYSPACYWDLKLQHKTRKECEAEAKAAIAEAYEDAAKIAESSHERWHDEMTAHEVECDATACQDIAAAIRARTPADAQAARAARDKRARDEALREAAARIHRKIKAAQPEMTRRAQRLAEGKKPGFQYALRRADLDARMSDRDMILALIDHEIEEP